MADSGFIQKMGIPLGQISRTSPDDIWPVDFKKHGLKRVPESDVARDELIMYTAIRDPINRLISAYKDKIGRTEKSAPSRQYFWRLYSMHIVRHYRNEERLVTSFEATAKAKGLIPTFREFVDFVIDWKLGELPAYFNLEQKRCDGHWCPQTQTVPFCNNKFGAIAQGEIRNNLLFILAFLNRQNSGIIINILL